MSKLLKTKPQIIVKNGKPSAVILDIADYQNMLERLEDKEDMADLKKIREAGLSVRKFDDFLKERKDAL